MGELAAGAAQGGHGKCQWIEPLIIPQLGEVKTNGGRLAMLAALHPLDEPAQALFGGGLFGSREMGVGGRRARGKEGFNGNRGFFDGGGQGARD